MTKRQAKEKAKANRVWFDMNTGTRTHKSKKDYRRKKNWRDWQKDY